MCAAEVDDFDEIVMLRQHAARHDEVGPLQIVVAQRLSIAVDQTDRP